VFLVFLAALDFGAVGLLMQGPGPPVMALVSSFGMLNLLAVLLYRLIVARGERRPFLVGFVLTGLALVPVVAAGAEAARDPLGWRVSGCLDANEWTRGPFARVRTGAAGPMERAAVIGLGLVLLNVAAAVPWLLMATAGGWVAVGVEHVAGRAGEARRAGGGLGGGLDDGP
jgi:hypothetical protein